MLPYLNTSQAKETEAKWDTITSARERLSPRQDSGEKAGGERTAREQQAKPHPPGGSSGRRPWTSEEDAALLSAVSNFGERKWKQIAENVSTRDHYQCLQRWKNVVEPNLRKQQDELGIVSGALPQRGGHARGMEASVEEAQALARSAYEQQYKAQHLRKLADKVSQGKEIDIYELNKVTGSSTASSLPTLSPPAAGSGSEATGTTHTEMENMREIHARQREELRRQHAMQYEELQRLRMMEEQLQQEQMASQQSILMQQQHAQHLLVQNQQTIQQQQQQQQRLMGHQGYNQGSHGTPSPFLDPIQRKQWQDQEEEKEAALAEAELIRMTQDEDGIIDPLMEHKGMITDVQDLDTEMSLCSISVSREESMAGSRTGSRGSSQGGSSDTSFFIGKDENGGDCILNIPISVWDAFLDQKEK
ncbi:hypothetical protein TrVE_jg12337 [Triparma verrucosa]|uniref:Uncharacterized protein n=1 Tax=Triparma verrucosa TaxID=1606542 RepID=A0A9W7BCQ3_9STRA|nr:hypothetical protein TrVE_jg12337 [Triparma verrucosa]